MEKKEAQKLRDPLSLSDDELYSIGRDKPVLREKVKSVFVQGIQGMRYELERIERILSDFTQRGALLMTIAGILAFIPAIAGFDATYFKDFLFWTLPFLLGGLFFSYFSAIRVTAVLTKFPSVAEGEPEELVVFKRHALGIQQVWRKNFDVYTKAIVYYRATSTLVYLYIISFTVYLYLFAFGIKLEIRESALLLGLLLLLGTAMFSNLTRKGEDVKF